MPDRSASGKSLDAAGHEDAVGIKHIVAKWGAVLEPFRGVKSACRGEQGGTAGFEAEFCQAAR